MTNSPPWRKLGAGCSFPSGPCAAAGGRRLLSELMDFAGRSVLSVDEGKKPAPAPSLDGRDPLETVLRYHQETKHHFSRFARGPRHLDWANQPDPFRRYEGASVSALPLLKPDDSPASPLYQQLYHPGAIASASVSACSLSRLFEYS